MMHRCYNPHIDNFNRYGGQGCSVSADWQDLKTFLREAKELPHWNHKVNNWADFQLDKDYYGANHYSKDTCIWVTSVENATYMGKARKVIVTDAYANTTVYLSISAANRALSLNKCVEHLLDIGVILGPHKLQRRFFGWRFDTYRSADLLRYTILEEVK